MPTLRNHARYPLTFMVPGKKGDKPTRLDIPAARSGTPGQAQVTDEVAVAVAKMPGAAARMATGLLTTA